MRGGGEHALDNCPAPKALYLCVGARVMCLKNLGANLVNGSLGRVVSVTLTFTGGKPSVGIVVMFDGLLGSEPFSHTFKTHDPDAPDDMTNKFTVRGSDNKEKASRIQIPLRLAWACSIHKSQGMSLDRVVINFDRCFEDGQAYTALSRVRSLEGAWLLNLQFKHMGMVSKKAKQWYAEMDTQQWA